MSDMSWIRGFFGALVLAMAIAFSGLLPASPAFAQQIVVEGGSGVDAASLKPYFTGTNAASVQRGVDDLKATGIYSAVSARVVDGRIVVSLSIGKQILNRVAFEGESKITKEQLEVEVQSKPGTTYNEATAEGDIGRIKDAYKKYGRNEARVTKRLVQLPNGRVDLVFTIDEGDKTGIREIKFVGNHAVSDYRLHNMMQTSTMNLLSFIKTHGRLRSRPPRLRRGDDPALLHEERLRRLPHHQHRRRLSGEPARLRSHDHDGRGSAVPRLRRFGGLAHRQGGRAGAARGSPPFMRATSTTPARSTRRSIP